MTYAYLIRYGLMGRVGRFSAASDAYERGQAVVVRSDRGVELGEILLQARFSPASADDDPEDGDAPAARAFAPRVLRVAVGDDLERAERAEGQRHERFLACERVLKDGEWPIQVIDVEMMLDDAHTVLHYLGPHHLDVSGLLPAFRALCGFDVRLEPAGIDAPDDEPALQEAEAEFGCGSCGTGGGCGAGGGCGSGDDAHAGACSTCAVRELVRSRR